jgi:hypothetical protein
MERNVLTKRKVIGLWLVLFAAGMFIYSPSAWADANSFLETLAAAKGNIKVGDLRIHPGLEVQEGFESNIYNVSEHEKYDYINTITPGLLLSLGTKHEFKAGYALDINSYHEHPREDFTDQVGKAGVRLNFPVGVWLTFDDKYEKTKDPRPEERQLRASHWTNDMDMGVGYLFPAEKLSLEASYLQSYLKYDQNANEVLNKRNDLFGATLYYRFFPKTSAFIQYEYGRNDFIDSTDESTDKDSKAHAANVGLKWDATARLSGTLKSGMKRMEYDNRVDPNGDKYNEKDLWSVSGALQYKVSKRTSIDLTLNRSLNDTAYGGDGDSTYSGASYYIDSSGTIGLNQKLAQKISLSLDVGYKDHKYNSLETDKRGRQDYIVDAGGEVTFEVLRTVAVSLEYKYSDADSNDEDREERHDDVYLRVSVAL